MVPTLKPMRSESLEAWVRRAANSLGIDITRYHPDRSEAGRLVSMLRTHSIDCVLDIGANRGQFATSIRRAGYKARILSVEPLSTAHQELLLSSKHDRLWQVAPRTALGAAAGQTTIHVSGNSVSSSLLRMLARHSDAAPGSATVLVESVPMATLDQLLLPLVDENSRLFLKIDTQGSESSILDGAAATLGRCQGIQLELSLVPLYENQVLFDELAERIRRLGFNVWAIWPAFFDPASGQMLQADATFFRDPPQR